MKLRRCLQCDKLTLENTGTKDQTDSSSSSTKHHTTTTTSIDRLRSPSLVNPLTWILHEIWHNRACRADLDTNWYQLIRSTTLYLLIKELFNWLVSLTGDKGERCRLLVFMVFFSCWKFDLVRENKSVFVVDFNQARQLNNFQFSKSSNDSRLRKQI